MIETFIVAPPSLHFFGIIKAIDHSLTENCDNCRENDSSIDTSVGSYIDTSVEPSVCSSFDSSSVASAMASTTLTRSLAVRV